METYGIKKQFRSRRSMITLDLDVHISFPIHVESLKVVKDFVDVVIFHPMTLAL